MNLLDDKRLPQSFWAKVSPEPNSGCWLWTAASNNGYGVTSGGPRSARWRAKAHRLCYETLVGVVPVGLDLDHLCRVRCCVNPAHLEPVTRAENLSRSPITAHSRKFATHCKRGHELVGANLRLTPSPRCSVGYQRMCIACEKQRYATTYSKNRALVRAAQKAA